jgi:hypothetical protein
MSFLLERHTFVYIRGLIFDSGTVHIKHYRVTGWCSSYTPYLYSRGARFESQLEPRLF